MIRFSCVLLAAVLFLVAGKHVTEGASVAQTTGNNKSIVQAGVKSGGWTTVAWGTEVDASPVSLKVQMLAADFSRNLKNMKTVAVPIIGQKALSTAVQQQPKTTATTKYHVSAGIAEYLQWVLIPKPDPKTGKIVYMKKYTPSKFQPYVRWRKF